MGQHELSIKIKPAEESQLDLFVIRFSPDNPMFQYNRYDVQRKGEGLYLIAWYNNMPIGHFLLRWSGPQDEYISKKVDITRSAFLEAGLTKDDYRKKGVATAIIKESERLAKEKGCLNIGIEVGSTDNPDAKRLYEKLGYIDSGYGEFLVSWECMDSLGNKSIDSEVVIYMQKVL
jgi:GNAT superfamily N-acetyltransferase